jgi:hypothetical protein
MPSSHSQQYPPWHVVEKKIQEEINWLRNSIETFSSKEEYAPVTCRECLMRRIAILIISGKVKATQIRKIPPLKSFWINKKRKRLNKAVKCHGGDWHQETMNKIENHFLSQGFEVIREPNLHWGRADLGVFKKNNQDLYIEVGTTSFFKLWINLEMMQKFIYLIVPNDDELIEFRKH